MARRFPIQATAIATLATSCLTFVSIASAREIRRAPACSPTNKACQRRVERLQPAYVQPNMYYQQGYNYPVQSSRYNYNNYNTYTPNGYSSGYPLVNVNIALPAGMYSPYLSGGANYNTPSYNGGYYGGGYQGSPSYYSTSPCTTQLFPGMPNPYAGTTYPWTNGYNPCGCPSGQRFSAYQNRCIDNESYCQSLDPLSVWNGNSCSCAPGYRADNPAGRCIFDYQYSSPATNNWQMQYPYGYSY